MNFTEQQHEAIYTHDKNLIVVAGAGSGKTRVLVERYLALLDANQDWQLNHLVAITFTDAAAQEMRVRVRKALEEQLTKAETPETLERFSALLSQMDGARISTIHGLCSTILRANAAEAGLDPAFEVLDEVEARLLLETTVDDVLQSLREDDPDDLLLLFTRYDDYAIRNFLAKPEHMEAPLKDLPDNPETIVQQAHADWLETLKTHVGLLQQDTDFMDALYYADGMNVPADDKLMQCWQYVQQQRTALLDVSSPEAVKSCIAAINILSDTKNLKLNVGAAPNWGGKAGKEAAIGMLRLVRERMESLKAQIQDFDEALEKSAAEALIRWDKLLQRVRHAYHQCKQERAMLDFNDLEQRAAQLLENPHVQARYRNAEFKHLLVDEFQDTNAAQWHIVKALADINQPGSLFVVGDLKQSIYGFRGADVSVFGDVRREIAEPDSGDSLPLNMSFRSQPGLIAIFNKLFARILQPDEGSRVIQYEVQFDKQQDALNASRDDAPADASLELLLLNKKPPGEKKTLKDEVLRPREAYEIGRRLQRMYDERMQIYDKEIGKERDFNYGDVAILMRALTKITIYEDVFKSLGIPYRTLSGRGYYDRQEIWDVMNVLKSLYNPTDNLILAAALRSPMFNFSDELLLALRLLSDEDESSKKIVPLHEALHRAQTQDITGINGHSDREKLTFAYETLASLRHFIGRVTISDLLRQILAATGYLAILTGLPDGARRRLNVEKLLEIADKSGRIMPGEFARYIDDLSTKSVREGEAYLEAEGAVRFMSIHASKGLEFPIVVLANASSGRNSTNTDVVQLDPVYGLTCKAYAEAEQKHVKSYYFADADALQQQREAAERKRLLYVAVTRARDKLIISGDYNHEKNTASFWLGQILEAVHEAPAENRIIQYAGEGKVALLHPEYDVDALQFLTPPDTQSADDLAALAEGATPAQANLMASPVIEPAAFMGHIAATGLADLGWYIYERKAYQRSKIRRETLHDAPGRVHDIIRKESPRVTQRMLGNIVHEVLRYWHFEDAPQNLDDTLHSYIWQQNITDENLVEDALRRSRKILVDFQQTQLYDWIQAAQHNNHPVYPEMPFIYRTEKRIIHGIIDVLFQREDGTWIVLDYKTSYIPGFYDNPEKAAREHARRYYLQVGAYAAAVMEQMSDIVPEVYVHYLRYNHSVNIPAQIWQSELMKLEQYIGQVIHDAPEITPG